MCCCIQRPAIEAAGNQIGQLNDIVDPEREIRDESCRKPALTGRGMDYQKPLQFRAYEALREMIRDGRFEYDKMYSETRVSKDLGVSRTPMRDAIQRLAQERYIEVIPSKGFRLHRMTEKDLLETYQVRCALEGFCCVQLARDYREPEARRVIRRMESLIGEQEGIAGTTESIEDFTLCDQEFHKKMIDYVANASLTALFDNYLHQISRQIRLSLRQPGRLRQTVDEHKAIVEALKSGSVDRSYLAILAHLEQPRMIIKTLGVMQESTMHQA